MKQQKTKKMFWLGVGIYYLSLLLLELTILFYVKEMFYVSFLTAGWFGVLYFGMLIYIDIIVFEKEKKK